MKGLIFLAVVLFLTASSMEYNDLQLAEEYNKAIPEIARDNHVRSSSILR